MSKPHNDAIHPGVPVTRRPRNPSGHIGNCIPCELKSMAAYKRTAKGRAANNQYNHSLKGYLRNTRVWDKKAIQAAKEHYEGLD